MKKNFTVSDFIIEFLSKEKVKHIFLLPGGGNMFLIDAVAKSKKVKGIPFHHEHAISIAAEAYSRISNNIGVAIVTTGPGSTNAITGLLGSWIESVPLIIISGQVKTSDIKKRLKLRQQGVQGVNITKIVNSITKFSFTLKKTSNFENILKKSITTAKENRGGPVWIDVPLDVQAKLISKKKIFNQKKIVKKKLTNAQQNTIKNLLLKSKRPVFLIGHGVRLAKGTNSFIKALNKFKIPSIFTWNAMDILEYKHSLNYGRPGVVAQRFSNFVIQSSDLLISIGCRIDNIITAFNQKKFAPYAKKIIVDIDNNEIKKFNFKIKLKLNFDAKNFFDELIKIKFPDHNNFKKWKDKCEHWKKNFSFDRENIKSKKIFFDHYFVVNKLSDKFPKNLLICTGSSGLAIEVFYLVFKNKPGQRIFLTSGLGSMGYGIPASIGACFANKKKPMVLIEGDGSFHQNIQELAVIKKFNLPITIFIFNNKGYSSIRNTQKNYFKGRYLGTGPESNLIFPDLKNISNAYGIKYLEINSIKKFNNQIDKIIKNLKIPKIIDLKIKPNEILKPKVSAIPLKNGNIISMPLEDMSPLLPLKVIESEMLVPLSKNSYKIKR